ncbi:hypothetical protein RND81_05G085900 [Saponaria officinalis]|uniref:Uncharacterized protein n=1 Tax=Saponaria officinalis TaxID=3572 RepID=A0AAW1KW38_SAPOF
MKFIKLTRATHGITKEGITRQHGTNIGERTAIGDHAPGYNPGAYQVSETTTTHYVPGLEETLGWSRTDTGTLPRSENQAHEHRHTPGIGHSGGTHSTGDLGIGHKPKLGGILEKDTCVRKNTGEDVRPVHYRDEVSHPTGGGVHGIPLSKEGIAEHHGTHICGDYSGPGAYQVFDPKTTHYVPGMEETLGWSRTDTGTLPESEVQPRAFRHTPDVHSSGIHSTGDSGVGHKPKIGGIIEKDSHVLGQDIHPANYQANVGDPAGADYKSAAGQHFGLEHGVTERHHGGTTMGRGSHIPVSKPVEYEPFDTTGSRYIPGQDETMGWSVTDTARSKLAEEQPFAPKNTPIMARQGHQRTEEMGEPGMLREVLDKRTVLEKDPHAPRDFGGESFPENYQSKVVDPTGRGGEEIGATPILHQLGKMSIHDESTRESDLTMKTVGQQERLFRPNLGQTPSTGSHDQFSPEPVTKPQFDTTTIPSGLGLLREEENKPESYTDMISSAASELTSKAKQATGSVTSKLGYGGTHETPTNQQGSAEYGETRAGRLEHERGEDRSVAGSIGDYGKKVVSTVYDKVAGLGSGSGVGPEHEHDVGSTLPSDKGVSVKEYLADKLKPGEDDKALSKAISEALPLHKSKERTIGLGEGDEVTEVTKVVIKGRVTESEEVAKSLGRSEDKDYDGLGPGLATPGKSVMDRICDAAGSWFNTSGDPGIESDHHTEEGNERTQGYAAAREVREAQ